MNTKYLSTVLAPTAVLLSLVLQVRASETDDRIEASFRKTFVYETYLKMDAIKISVKEGVATLSGEVTNETHRPIAEEVTEALPGVKRVDNQIRVVGEPFVEKSDDWIAIRVKVALLFHRHVDAVNTEVVVKDGIVTLKGEAASRAQLELTTEYAKDVDGVRSVNNEMTLPKSPSVQEATVSEKIDDASITAQAKMALLFHRSTGVLRTKVSTTDGIVILTGTTRNAAERELVTKLVGDVHGVKGVMNRMTVTEENR